MQGRRKKSGKRTLEGKDGKRRTRRTRRRRRNTALKKCMNERDKIEKQTWKEGDAAKEAMEARHAKKRK
jgi:hypothetical protein